MKVFVIKSIKASTTVDIPTGIYDVKTDTAENDKWYDLCGRPVNGKPSKAGIYIKNNKKVVIQ